MPSESADSKPAQVLRQLADSFSGAGRTSILLAASLVLGPFWPVPVPGFEILTIGRGLLAVVLASVAIDLLRGDHRQLVHRRCLALFAALGLLLGVIAISSATRGCNCTGGFAGLLESSLVIGIAVVVAYATPTQRPLLLASAVAGVMFGGLLAAIGVGDLADTVANPTPGGRLGGIYGNSNFLAFAVAFAPPWLVARLPRSMWRTRLIVGAGLLLVSVLIVLTFSRGGAIAAATGAVAALVVSLNGRRRRLIATLGALAGIAAVAFLAYPIYADERLDADLGELAEAPVDLSGWDPTAQGAIPNEPSTLTNNPTGALVVATTEPGQGASIAIGEAAPQRSYTAEFELRADAQIAVVYALGDNFEANGLVAAEGTARPEWDEMRLRWVPTASSPAARFYLHTPESPGTVFIRDVRVVTREGGRIVAERPLPTRLRGATADLSEQRETRFLESRLEGLKLGTKAFLSSPLLGIGWEHFPTYAANEGDFGELPTHNEYMRFAAELGILGLLPILIVALLFVRGVAEVRDDRLRWATIGVVVAGAVGLLFANALATSFASTPLLVALAVGCVGEQPTQRRGPIRPSSDQP